MTFPFPQITSLSQSPVDISFVTSAYDDANLSSYTFSSKSLGTEAGDRRILVCVGSRLNSAATPTGCTVAGVTATEVNRANNPGSGADIATIYEALVPSGTTGDIVVTFSAAMLRCIIGVYRMTGAASGVPSDNDSDIVLTGSDLSAPIDVPVNGAVIAAAWVGGSASTSVAWTGATEGFDLQSAETSTTCLSGASLNLPAGETGRTITATLTGGPLGSCALAVASFAPVS